MSAARAASTRWTAASLAASSPASSSSAAASSLLRASACPLIPTATQARTPADRRHQSTANRTKRALNIAPHASFLRRGGGRDKAGAGSRSGSSGEVATTLGTIASSPAGGSSATLLYNPPASAPSVYQTPFKFLPKSDPRRRNNLMSFFKAAPPTAAAAAAPALAHRSYAPTPRYHLTEADVAEIRRLRALDPVEWSVHRLARQYNCSPIFVMLAVRSSAEHQKARKAEAEAARARWGPIRTKARADRVKRREMLYNGEL